MYVPASANQMRRWASQYGSFNVLTDAPSLAKWYRGDTTTNASGFVSQVTDKSGGGFHFTQATGSKQAALVAAGSDPNGRACIVADAVDDGYVNAAFGASTNCTIFSVTRSLALSASNATLLSWGNIADNQSIQVFQSTGERVLRGRYNNTAASTRRVDTESSFWSSSSVQIACVRHDSSASASATPITRGRLGVASSTNSSSSATVSTVAASAAGLFANKTSAANFFGGGLYEMIICNALLTDEQVLAISMYLAGYYGVT